MNEQAPHDEVSPESLMDRFRSPGLSKMLIVTLVVHGLLLVGTSIPFLLSAFGGEKTELSEDERIANAVSDARASLESIAQEHGLTTQELSKQFGPKTSSTTPSTSGPNPTLTPTPTQSSTSKPSDPEPTKSAIEKEIEVTKPGPDRPAIPAVDEEDLFGTE